MASGGHTLQQQKGNIEGRIRLLINADLKEICKAYNYQVSGNKLVLQQRCLEVLNTVVASGDRAKFDDLVYRVANHGANPPRPSSVSSSSNNYQSSPGALSTNGPMASGHNRPPGLSASRPTSGRYFKSSPFYEVLETVMPLQDLPDDPEMPQNRHTVRANLVLSLHQVTRLREEKSLKLLLYCGLSSQMTAYTPAEVAFPSQLEVKVNNDDVKSNFKGLKNKPGSTKPADVTDKVRKNAGYSNQIAVTYALTNKRYAFSVHLVRYITADTLTQRVRLGKSIPRHKVLEEMSRANADPDIAATAVRMSLKDPISTMRITLPVRSTVCSHNQCFDGNMFLQLQDQAPQWSCPVCNKHVTFDSLCVDKYFEDILQKVGPSIDKVDIEPNGEWTVIKEEEDASQAYGQSSSNGRASYDDDIDEDDDLVEIVEPQAKSVPVGSPRATRMLMSPALQHHQMNTPPLSSREASVAQSTHSAPQSNKRPASSVIDLTLSDEDEPPRPAKRQSTHLGSSAQTYNPPTSTPSIPTPRYPSHSSAVSHSTDTYRPTSNADQSFSNVRSVSTSSLPAKHNSTATAAPQSPVASARAASYGSYGNSSASWAVSQPQPSPPIFQPFNVRPSAPPISSSSGTPQSPGNTYHLPAFPPAPNLYGGGWPRKNSGGGSGGSFSPPG